MIGLSIPMAKKARYMLPMLPMAAIIAAYPFQGAQGRVFQWLRGLMQGLWLLIPGLLIVGLLVAKRRFAEHLTSATAVMAILGVLQVIALGLLFKPRVRTVGLAFTAVLALWSTYILVVEPVERTLYDTRTFSRAAVELIQKDPAPVVLHAMGKDAKAIKFMVNVEQDLFPVFTHSVQELENLKGPAWLVMDKSDYEALKGSRLAALQPVLNGSFDKDDYVLLHLLPAQP